MQEDKDRIDEDLQKDIVHPHTTRGANSSDMHDTKPDILYEHDPGNQVEDQKLLRVSFQQFLADHPEYLDDDQPMPAKDEEFLLTPSDEDHDREDDSGSQVISLPDEALAERFVMPPPLPPRPPALPSNTHMQKKTYMRSLINFFLRLGKP